ncbi:MAG: diguanylate cyclase [Geobacter sp.]|nr:MAG: diguanylate cyclase [Geobacter sp.]
MSSEVAGTEVRHKILIIDDTPTNIQILNEILRDTYDIFFASNGREGIGISLRELPDLILLDIMMPEMDGYVTCTILKSDPRTSPIPVIFITAMSAPGDEAKGLDCGAIDYITKPISPPIVKSRVRNHLELKRHRDTLQQLTVELEEKNRELDRLSREDGLTGIANRRHFDEVLQAEMNRSYRSRQFMSLIFCDVDFFKRYNDHYGHMAGDRCLQVISGIMRRTFKRAGDLCARYGGEEFMIILPDTTPDKAVYLAEKLRQALVAEAMLHALSDAAGYVTVSMGVVGAQVTTEHNAEWFVQEADKALYQSKSEGRNRITVAS